MSTFLTIASDFIDRMSNPAYGVLVNEEYALRFAELLAEEGELQHTLRREAERLTNVHTLTAHGWVWFLGWAQSEGVRLSDNLLLEITERWTNVLIQSLAIETAVQDVEWERAANTALLVEFPNDFLRHLMIRAVEPPRRIPKEGMGPDALRHPDHIRTDRAEAVFVALLDVELDITLDAASALLNHRWEGQEELLQHYRHLASGVDPETRQQWEERLRPPWFKQ